MMLPSGLNDKTTRVTLELKRRVLDKFTLLLERTTHDELRDFLTGLIASDEGLRSTAEMLALGIKANIENDMKGRSA